MCQQSNTILLAYNIIRDTYITNVVHFILLENTANVRICSEISKIYNEKFTTEYHKNQGKNIVIRS